LSIIMTLFSGRLAVGPSPVPKSEGVKCRDMVYILSPDILYSFPMLG
jgi:hypothetical protein